MHRVGDAKAPTAEQEAEYLKVLDLELEDGEDLAGRIQVPAQVDNTRLAPPPSNQFQLGACAAFAYGYGLGTAASANGTRDVSQLKNQESPAYAYKAALVFENFTGVPTDYGVFAASVLTPMVENESGDYATVPYPQTEDKQVAAQQIAAIPLNQFNPDFLLGSWAEFGSQGSELLEDIKQRLATGQVVGFETDLYPGFGDFEGPGVFSSNAAPEKGSYHAMLIVGYDDNRTYLDAGGQSRQGALRVQNSWGQNFGERGYIWLAYDTFLRTENLRAFMATPWQRTAPPVEPTGTLLSVTPSNGTRGQITSVSQDQFRLQQALVVNYRFEDAVNVTNVTLGTADQALKATVRNGQFYWIRQDGHSYPSGPSLVTISATARDGRALTYTGNVVVPDLPGVTPAPPPAVERGTNGQDPP